MQNSMLACLHELDEGVNAGPGRARQPCGLRYVRAGMLVSQKHHDLHGPAIVAQQWSLNTYGDGSMWEGVAQSGM